MRSPVPLTAGAAALVALGALSELSAQTATRSSIPTRTARVAPTTTVARSGPEPLSTTEKLTILGGVAGATDAAALAEPVRLTVTRPNHADRIYVNTKRTAAEAYPEAGRWILPPKEDPFLTVLLVRAVMTRPALVDCVVTAAGGAGSAATVRVEKGMSGATAEVTIKGSYQHLTTVLLPGDAGAHAAGMAMRIVAPGSLGLHVHYCEVTGMKG